MDDMNKAKANDLLLEGIQLINEGSLSSAIEILTKALDLDPENSDFFFNRGFAYLEMGELDTSIDDFSKAIEISPEVYEYFFNRGNAYFDLGKYQLAVSDYDVAIKINPGDSALFNNRGNAFEKLGEIENSLANYSESVRLDPDNPDTYYNRASLFLKQGQYLEAIHDLNELIAKVPNDFMAYHMRGLAWKNKRNFEQAINDFSESIWLNPGFSQSFIERGYSISQIDYPERNEKVSLENEKYISRFEKQDYVKEIEGMRSIPIDQVIKDVKEAQNLVAINLKMLKLKTNATKDQYPFEFGESAGAKVSLDQRYMLLKKAKSFELSPISLMNEYYSMVTDSIQEYKTIVGSSDVSYYKKIFHQTKVVYLIDGFRDLLASAFK
jgi:tetratricopeptide (TPR) repeat protein